MTDLIKKDLLLYVLITIPSQVILSLVWLLTFNELNVLVVLVQIFFVFFIILLITSHSEQVEENNNGYEFLKNLPVTTSEIVGAKFTLILSNVIILGLMNILLFSFFPSNPQDITPSISAMVLTCCGALIFSALLNIGIFYLGFEIFMRITSFLIVVVVFGFLFLMDKKLDTFNVTKDLVNFLYKADLIFYILLAFLLYIGLMFLAILARRVGKMVKL